MLAYPVVLVQYRDLRSGGESPKPKRRGNVTIVGWSKTHILVAHELGNVGALMLKKAEEMDYAVESLFSSVTAMLNF